MKLFFDTNVLVDLERKREETLRLLERAQGAGHELWISTVSVSEIFTGVYLRKDADKAADRARESLGQFQWKDLDGEVAQTTGQIIAFLLSHGKRIEYQDCVVAASCLVETADRLVTDNDAHFRPIPGLGDRVLTTKEALTKVGKKT